MNLQAAIIKIKINFPIKNTRGAPIGNFSTITSLHTFYDPVVISSNYTISKSYVPWLVNYKICKHLVYWKVDYLKIWVELCSYALVENKLLTQTIMHMQLLTKY